MSREKPVAVLFIIIASLFIIAKNWKQPKYPLISEWLSKLYYTHTLEYYSTIKRNKLWIHETTQMYFKGTVLSEKRISKDYILYDSISTIFLK